MSLREKAIRKFTNADNRLAFDELFFLGKDLQRVPNNHRFRKYLEMIRLAPSASNKQPWRVVVEDDKVHFFLKRTKGYGTASKLDIQAIDMGIAISHLYLTLKEDKYTFEFLHKQPFELEEMEYIVSISIRK